MVRRWRRPVPRLRPWHQRVLRLLTARGPMTAEEVGQALYKSLTRSERVDVARYELLELHDMKLVQRDRAGLRPHDKRERWHLDLLAGIALEREPKPARTWPTLGDNDLARTRSA